MYTKEWEWEEYMDYINEPKQFINPVRDLILFDSSIVEPFTKCKWWIMAMFWAIIVFQMVPDMQGSIAKNLGLMILGAQYFFLVEYTFHRFVFHGEQYWMSHVPKTSEFYVLHFLLHGIHHAFP